MEGLKREGGGEKKEHRERKMFSPTGSLPKRLQKPREAWVEALSWELNTGVPGEG